MMIRIWVYDGVLASGVAGAIDVFHAANSVKLEGSDGPKLHWRVESSTANRCAPHPAKRSRWTAKSPLVGTVTSFC